MVNYETKQALLAVYTRPAQPGRYPDGLARSVHFAACRDGKFYEAWNENYGILFAAGIITEQNTILPKCVKHPRLARLKDGGFAVLARRVEEDGGEDGDSRGKVLLWTTEDFISFTEHGLTDADSLEGRIVQRGEWKTALSGPWGPKAEDGEEAISVLPVDASLCDRAALYWGRLSNTQIRLPERVSVSDAGDLDGIRAQAVYTDGSVSCKRVVWDDSGVDYHRAGEYTVKGRVESPCYPFPLDRGWGDPVVFPWEGKYYFIATNDNRNDVGLYVREADRPEELFEPGIRQHLILDYDERRELIQTFWAPEFHVIGGRLYLLFAVGPEKWGPQCHLMRLKEGGRITEPGDWEDPVRVRKKDGSFLCEDGITLDMTYIKGEKDSWMVWSYRYGINSPLDTGSMLCTARIREDRPWQLDSDPVILSRPLYGWENTEGTINNEGPHAFVRNGRVYLTYSGGAANGYTYVLGLLCADASADLCDPAVWEKSKTPVLSFYSVEGEYGPGHNSFFTDPEGELMIACHGETAIDDSLRCPGIRRVHFDLQDRPRFDLSPERDLNPALRDVCITVVTDGGGETGEA